MHHLVLEDGTVFRGIQAGAAGVAASSEKQQGDEPDDESVPLAESVLTPTSDAC